MFYLLGFSHKIFIEKDPLPPIYYNLVITELGKSRALEGMGCAQGDTELR